MTILFTLLIFILGLFPSFLISSSGQQKSKARDAERKSDINAIYSQLEQHYIYNYEYPTSNELETEFDIKLPGLDTEAVYDPNKHIINNPAGSYQYIPDSCSAIGCKHYKLIARLEDGTTYEKVSLN